MFMMPSTMFAMPSTEIESLCELLTLDDTGVAAGPLGSDLRVVGNQKIALSLVGKDAADCRRALAEGPWSFDRCLLKGKSVVLDALDDKKRFPSLNSVPQMDMFCKETTSEIVATLETDFKLGKVGQYVASGELYGLSSSTLHKFSMISLGKRLLVHGDVFEVPGQKKSKVMKSESDSYQEQRVMRVGWRDDGTTHIRKHPRASRVRRCNK
ncbi:hypothetical protein ACOSQ4_021825 [Xanthoceras sorbifolium]